MHYSTFIRYFFDNLIHLIRIYITCCWINIYKHRFTAIPPQRVSGSYKAVRSSNYFTFRFLLFFKICNSKKDNWLRRNNIKTRPIIVITIGYIIGIIIGLYFKFSIVFFYVCIFLFYAFCNSCRLLLIGWCLCRCHYSDAGYNANFTF